MGITGLIPFLEKASSKVHLKDLRGCSVAVDTYCWLHKGVFSCAEKLVRGEDTDQYLHYCLRYVEMLLSYDIKPILVFDGRHLPAKAQTERRRRDARKQSKQRAAELLRLGRIDEARNHMRRCVDVTHEMALKLIRECHKRNVDCIVAPYEADAQMAWLNKVNLVKYVVTEDSDLTLFGAQNIIFKLDLTGAGLLVESEKLYLTMGCPKPKYSFEKFLRMCILSGCDYVDSLPGIGLAKACKFILKTEEDNMCRALKKIPQYLNMRQLEVTDDYIESFLKAEATFRHMYIFNTHTRKMERLHALEAYATETRYCENAGVPLESEEQALQLALGNLNPFTLKQLHNWHPDRNFGLGEALPKHIKRAKHRSIWQLSSSNSMLQQSPIKTSQQPQCALFFKKIDLRQAIDDEYSANLRAENAKPMEADLFKMYKQEAGKRKRDSFTASSLESDHEDDEQKTEPMCEEEQPSSSSKQRHNPFAKSTTKPAVVCANASLLRALSPRKMQLESTEAKHETGDDVRCTKPPPQAKRNIFEKVEVRSRFFATNPKPQQTKTIPAFVANKSLADEFDKIEKLSEQNQIQQGKLYACNSPSPRKKPRLELKSKIETENDDEQEKQQEVSNSKEDNYSDVNKESAIVVISDYSGDEDLDLTKNDSSTMNRLSNGSEDDFKAKGSSTISRLNLFQAAQNIGRPRLGLSKTSKGSAQLKAANKVSLTNNNKSQDQSQTRLSMFGFRKRPILNSLSK